MAVTIRRALESDFEQMLPIFKEVIQGGDTYDFEETASDEDAYEYWFGKGVTSFVAVENGKVLGYYKIIANHRGRGSHVANASFMVDSNARGKGIGRIMGEDCLKTAKALGFKSMQFNYVISTNERAMRLWKSLGFNELCRLPGAFNHKKLGYVDAVIFFKDL